MRMEGVLYPWFTYSLKPGGCYYRGIYNSPPPFLKIYFLSFCVWVFCLPACMCIYMCMTYVPGAMDPWK